MREIEFRDYDCEAKVMRYFNLDQYDREEHNSYGNIMQYTGLKDKNGTKIYEDDIVVVRELHDGDDDAWVQTCGPAIPCIVSWDDYYKRFDFKGCRRIIHHSDHFEVIGNIHQNPELIGEVQA